MTDFSYKTRIALGGDALYLQLGGVHAYDPELAEMHALLDAVTGHGFRAVIFDYRPCRITHEIEEYGRIAALYRSRLPVDFPTAFVFAPHQAARVIFMTRRLAEAGMPARGFDALRPAVRWAAERLDEIGPAEPERLRA